MKGHDGLCPTPNPHLIERQHCAYCHLIERVKEHYKSKGKSEHRHMMMDTMMVGLEQSRRFSKWKGYISD
jgi:hypothetical protein